MKRYFRLALLPFYAGFLCYGEVAACRAAASSQPLAVLLLQFQRQLRQRFAVFSASPLPVRFSGEGAAPALRSA